MKTKQVIVFDESISVNEINNYFLPKLNECILSGKITEIRLDFSNVMYISVDAFLPLLRAIMVGALYLKKRQSSFRFSIEDATTQAFMYIYHTGIFNILSDYCKLDEEQTARIEYYMHSREFNPANRILKFDRFREYIKYIDENLLSCSDWELMNDRALRNKIEALISWPISRVYRKTIDYIRTQYGDQYCDVVIGQIIEIATNAIVHSKSKSYLYFQQGIYLPKESAIKGKKETGIFIGVGDIGEGFIKSLRVKKDQAYLGEFSEIVNRALRGKDFSEYSENQRYGIQNMLGIFEAIYFSWYKENETGWQGFYSLIKKVTLWGGVVTIIYDNCEISFDNFGKFEDVLKTYIKKICERNNDKYLRLLDRKIPGVQINIEIVGDRR